MKNIWKIATVVFLTTLLIGFILNSIFSDINPTFLVVILAVMAFLTIIISFFIIYKNEDDELKQRKHL